MMLNLDMLINSKRLPPDHTEIAIRANQTMLDVMVAGATGEFRSMNIEFFEGDGSQHPYIDSIYRRCELLARRMPER